MEVIVVAYDSVIQLISLTTGQVIHTLKASDSTLSSHNALSVDDASVVRTVHTSKALVHTYVTAQFVHRSPVPEQLFAIESAHRGSSIVVGGGASGHCYVWCASSGELMRVWSAHYRKCSVLRFLSDDSLLVTGGDDAIVNVWSVAQLLTMPLLGRVRKTDVAPLFSSSAHSLPITDIVLHNGVLGHVYSASLDRTVKVWHLESDTIVLSVVLSSAIHCIALTPNATRLYAGLETGAVQVIELLSAHSLSNAHSFDADANADAVADATIFVGHSGAVTTMALSMDGTMLITGARDAAVRVWDANSGQTLRTHVPKTSSQTKAATTVCALRLMLRPARTEAALATVDAAAMKELPILRKYQRETAMPSLHEVAGMTEIRIEANGIEASDDELVPLDSDDAQHESLLRLTAKRVALYRDADESTTARIERLQAELVDARNEARRWRSAAHEMLQLVGGDTATDELP